MAHGLLHAQIRVLLQTLVLTLDVADGSRNDQFTATCLLSSSFDGTLTQQVQFILVQAALESKQEPVVREPWGINHLLVNQHGIDHPADFHELLPLPAVPCKSRNLAGRNGTDLAQADFSHHALKACTRHGPGCGSPQVLVDYLDLAPPQLPQSCFHRVLQLLALQVMDHLIRR